MQTLPVGSRLLLFPDKTKSGANGPIPATVTGDLLCPAELLNKMIETHQKLGHPITNYIIRSLDLSTASTASAVLRFSTNYSLDMLSQAQLRLFGCRATIPGHWTVDALSLLEMGQHDQTMVDANNQAHLNARASSWLFMLDACEELLPATRLVGFNKEACVCGLGQDGDTHTAVKSRFQQRMQNERAQVRKTSSCYQDSRISDLLWSLLHGRRCQQASHTDICMGYRTHIHMQSSFHSPLSLHHLHAS